MIGKIISLAFCFFILAGGFGMMTTEVFIPWWQESKLKKRKQKLEAFK